MKILINKIYKFENWILMIKVYHGPWKDDNLRHDALK